MLYSREPAFLRLCGLIVYFVRPFQKCQGCCILQTNDFNTLLLHGIGYTGLVSLYVFYFPVTMLVMQHPEDHNNCALCPYWEHELPIILLCLVREKVARLQVYESSLSWTQNIYHSKPKNKPENFHNFYTVEFSVMFPLHCIHLATFDIPNLAVSFFSCIACKYWQ